MGDSTPLGLGTLRLMRMFICRGSKWVFTPNQIEQLAKKDEAKNEELDDESDSESSLLSASTSVSGAGLVTARP